MTNQPTQGKGRPTPKRSDAQKKKPVAQPAPRNRKEAAARMRAQRKEKALAQRTAMKTGDVSGLPPRERAPERVIARDFVDARRSAGILFLPAAAVLFLSNLTSRTSAVSTIAGIVWLIGIAVIIFDSSRIYIGVSRLIRARVPESTSRRSACFYAMSRATLIRRWRLPSPRIQRGDPIPD